MKEVVQSRSPLLIWRGKSDISIISSYKVKSRMYIWSVFSRIRLLFATLWTVARRLLCPPLLGRAVWAMCLSLLIWFLILIYSPWKWWWIESSNRLLKHCDSDTLDLLSHISPALWQEAWSSSSAPRLLFWDAHAELCYKWFVGKVGEVCFWRQANWKSRGCLEQRAHPVIWPLSLCFDSLIVKFRRILDSRAFQVAQV